MAVAAGGGPKESEASGWPWWVAIERIVWPLLLCAFVVVNTSAGRSRSSSERKMSEKEKKRRWRGGRGSNASAGWHVMWREVTSHQGAHKSAHEFSAHTLGRLVSDTPKVLPWHPHLHHCPDLELKDVDHEVKLIPAADDVLVDGVGLLTRRAMPAVGKGITTNVIGGNNDGFLLLWWCAWQGYGGV